MDSRGTRDMKKLAMLLAICLLAAMLPMGTLAEDVQSAAVDTAMGNEGEISLDQLLGQEGSSAEQTDTPQQAGEQPAQPVEGEQAAQPTEGEQPAQTTEGEQPAQPAEAEQPVQPAEAEQLAQPAEAEQPAQTTEGEKPAEPVAVEQPAQPVEGEQATQQPTEGDQAAQQPAEGEQPAQQPVAVEQPAQPVEGEQATQQPAEGEQTAQQPSEGEQAAQQPAEGEQPAQPAEGEQPAQQPAEGEQPAQPSEGEPPVELAQEAVDTPVEPVPEVAVEAPPEVTEPVPDVPQVPEPLPAPHVDPNGPQLPAYDVILGVGESYALNAVMPAGREGAISYATPDAAIAMVSPEGVVTAVAVGDVRLTITAYDGTYAECDIHVRFAPQSASFAGGDFELGKGENVVPPQAVAGNDAGEAAGAYTLVSSNTKILVVEPNGTITAKKKGKAALVATYYNGVTASCVVTVRNAPKKVTLAAKSGTLGVGETAQIVAKLPKNTASRLTYTSENPGIAVVDASGAVQGVGVGATRVCVSSFNGKRAYMTVTVLPAPQTIGFPASEWVLGVGMSVDGASVDAGAAGTIAYNISNPAVVAINKGKLQAVGVGETEVVATTYNGLSATCRMIVKPAPQGVRLPYARITIGVGESIQLQPDVGDSASTFTYKSSSKKRVSVTADGLVTGLKKGNATITIKTYNKKSCKLKVVVQSAPPALAISPVRTELPVGGQMPLSSNKPATSYMSTNPEVAQVDASGVITAVAPGTAEIVATIENGQEARCAVTVRAPEQPDTGEQQGGTEQPGGEQSGPVDLVLTIPARTTDVSGIPGNLAKIDAIRVCAIQHIEALRSSGTISDTDAGKRRSMVNNCFADYAFPWMTPAYQAYWKAANSEGGVKDFQPDRVYYGLPYISGSGSNRLYNVPRALSEGRYTDSGAGYYLLNQGNLLNKKYCGNDCSGYVDAAIWGVGNKHSADRTTDIAKSSNYRTISGFDSMRTGDLICKSDSHVVMFLYYANADKSKIMIIENGGSEPGTNTVHCIIMDVAYYQVKGYKVRRLASLG